ncbi:hypothetical protein BVC80_733g6 [Macleaya cordata]|uniref:Uncharacterized protein n=1 Tax=Macleaya cordata TaxID=56857 RepID=A0A200PY87_MACCD|nr:hypothetical protein BVC80_733g6 [Macleaya cordata]
MKGGGRGGGGGEYSSSEMDVRTPLMEGSRSTGVESDRILVSILRGDFFEKLPNKVLCGVVDPEDPLNIDLSSTKGLMRVITVSGPVCVCASLADTNKNGLTAAGPTSWL